MGKLYICGTPIGNLQDVSIRLLKTLRQVDLIACEDTRNTVKLLNYYHIKKKMVSYHQYSDPGRERFLVEELLKGKQIALVSDAGMPALCDPGEGLLRKAIEAGVPIEIIPGPSALICALILSGFKIAPFVFEGYLPANKNERRKLLSSLKDEARTIVVYETPHRLIAALSDLEEILGQARHISVAREITKLHEEVKRGTIKEVKDYFTGITLRGEFCLVIEGKESQMVTPDLKQIKEEINHMVESGWNKKQALKMKAKEYGIKKSVIYNSMIEKDS
ncbi:MAG: 16S rRNA (cytidine(1402)-2'-O)-methyltransferase [Syntrophomonadaceae bacterium]|jgi:16S rRNA (cytidine1402-2'-O)-methyltransferase